MGARHSTLSSAAASNSENDSSALELEGELGLRYVVEERLFPGSGRMMKTYRVKSSSVGAKAVAKTMWISKEDESLVHDQQEELRRIKSLLRDEPHVAPFLYWGFGGDYRHVKATLLQQRPVYLLRSHVYTTLADRLACRPFLHFVEKVWIAYQLLQALDAMHSKNVVHGFITTENIGLTSWNWVVLLDIASYKSTTSLPDDDPSEYLYYFQETNHTKTSYSANAVTSTAASSTTAASGTTSTPPSTLNAAAATGSNATTAGSSTAAASGGGATTSSKGTTPREKRCYVAPERFVKASHKQSSQEETSTYLTPAMDMFSTGCVLMETFLNGERAMELGDVMEYRSLKKCNTNILQKLNKIESSSLRAACKHMISLTPSERLSARDCLERLRQRPEVLPSTLDSVLYPLLKRVTTQQKLQLVVTSDARVAVAAAQYEQVLWETMGIRDSQGGCYFRKVLGPTLVQQESDPINGDNHTQDMDANNNDLPPPPPPGESKRTETGTTAKNDDDLFAETETLLQQLESLTSLDTFDNDDHALWKSMQSSDAAKSATSSSTAMSKAKSTPTQLTEEPRSPVCKRSLLIYLQLVLSTVRHVQRPASKLVALQLMKRMGEYCDDDDARLQRIVPVTISLLQDVDSSVRAMALKVLTHTVSNIRRFPPSDSNVFGQYILKRVAPLMTDPALIVRLAFAQSLTTLAETALRFLDISHAVRLYEAVGHAGSTATRPTEQQQHAVDARSKKLVDAINQNDVFTEDMTKLLYETSSKDSTAAGPTTSTTPVTTTLAATAAATTTATTTTTTATTTTTTTTKTPPEYKTSQQIVSSAAGKTLISSTYNAELAALHETVSRWVVHLTTDLSEHAALPKRALLQDLTRLCHFFGLEGVMNFVLPQILAFLNDRQEWQLRAALFDHLRFVCHYIGRAATEHFVLPILESALVDAQEAVVCRALHCLALLIEMGLVSRAVLIGSHFATTNEPVGTAMNSAHHVSSSSLLKKYSPLLVHPASDVRGGAVAVMHASCKVLGILDARVYLVPILLPFLRFSPSSQHLENDLEKCLYHAWSRKRFFEEIEAFLSGKKNQSGNAVTSKTTTTPPTEGKWTSIGIQMTSTAESEKHGSIADATLTPMATSVTSNTRIVESHSESPTKKQQEPEIPPAQLECVREYLRMLVRNRAHSGLLTEPGKPKLEIGMERSLKLAQSIKFPRQDATRIVEVLPSWYNRLRESKEAEVSEFAAIRSVAALDQVYGLSVMGAADVGSTTAAADHSNITTTTATSDVAESIKAEDAVQLLRSPESKRIEAACAGQWGAETALDPSLLDTSLLISKLNALGVPPLPPRLLGEQQQYVDGSGSLFSDREYQMLHRTSAEWKPKVDALVATSSLVNGHTAPVVRISVSLDQRFFVTGSYDGTCRVWELSQVEETGVLESSVTYAPHQQQDNPGIRVNDIAMVEGSHSVVSGTSDGSIHVWRVDLVPSRRQLPEKRESWASTTTTSSPAKRPRSRVDGTSVVRELHPSEGEILAVSHFNSSSDCIITFATQKGLVHSWDLRCAREPFLLCHSQDTGYLTSMALGNDRNWIVTGTSRGFLALWDLRFQQMVKLWRHSRAAPVTRLACSFVPPPQAWGGGGKNAVSEPRPFVFAACGRNECAMFDVTDGLCRQVFRTVGDGGNWRAKGHEKDLPYLSEIPISGINSFARRSVLGKNESILNHNDNNQAFTSDSSINAMVGSIGAGDSNYLITGGADCRIRFWDFSVPSMCYVVSGQTPVQPRPSFERLDVNANGPCRLMLCRQAPTPAVGDIESAKRPVKLFQGMKRPESHHCDSIQDLKVVQNALISCSRDCTVKVWR